VVACDGVNSRLRRHHPDGFGTRIDTGRNRYMWLGTTKVFDSFTFAFVRTPAGRVWCHAYGFDAGTSTFIVECQPETWAGLGFGRLGLDDSIRRLEQLFEAQLDGHRLVAQAPAGDRTPWLGFRTVTNERWHHGRVVLAGDAAHTTHFTIGSGTKLAIEDAIGLAAALGDHRDLESALAAYEQRRKTACCCSSGRRATAPTGSRTCPATSGWARPSSPRSCTTAAPSCCGACPRPATTGCAGRPSGCRCSSGCGTGPAAGAGRATCAAPTRPRTTPWSGPCGSGP
jgi:hypothetical protein